MRTLSLPKSHLCAKRLAQVCVCVCASSQKANMCKFVGTHTGRRTRFGTDRVPASHSFRKAQVKCIIDIIKLNDSMDSSQHRFQYLSVTLYTIYFVQNKHTATRAEIIKLSAISLAHARIVVVVVVCTVRILPVRIDSVAAAAVSPMCRAYAMQIRWGAVGTRARANAPSVYMYACVQIRAE